MIRFLALGLFDLLARLPLPWLHQLGAWAGFWVYHLSPRYAARLRENLQLAHAYLPGVEWQGLLRENVRQMGMAVLELPWIWRRPLPQVQAAVRACHGLESLRQAYAEGKGVIVFTPHLGCFEIAALYLGGYMPATCLYRAPKFSWLEPVLRAGRERGGVRLASADLGGVRRLLRALKNGEAIGILPDQVPGKGEGEWVPFFGRPAYTMTLAARLATTGTPALFMAYAERLPHGAGYTLHLSPLALDRGAPVTPQLNRALEALIQRCPAQYLWSYNRYKIPRGVLPPENVGRPS